MKTRAALLHGPGQPWTVEEISLDGPRAGEVLVETAFAGLCHSDDHLNKGAGLRFPLVGGHEGSGVVREVGAGVTRLRPGDKVVTSFIPACGLCRWCTVGQSWLCDAGASTLTGALADGTYRMHLGDGRDAGGFCALGTFTDFFVAQERSLVKVPDDTALDAACLLGCSVPTGWGSAVRAAGVRPGDVVVVYGVGGVGAAAVQGALMGGAATVVTVDPVPFKNEFARRLGAHAGFTTHAEALDHVRHHTAGALADSVIQCVGVATERVVTECYEMTRKGGTLVLTGIADRYEEITVKLPGGLLTSFAKTVVGCLYGFCNPHQDVPMLLGLYRGGRLRLDEMVTRRYALDEIEKAYQDMADGLNIRGIVEVAR
ncbi:NDMA-dependent alcohol dehydrogenase [Pseudofrankia sp. BMG5.36]|uniref:NDMA-dependent alcohol dehydrogenase n=1 Tax=Pseudofrankia sp. BMG5.36 TaxID=1834512 RepID=UPI0008D96CED|nr:NDMA-dependent alcohol dehydrogenase [Pseudofrankia sp. BMG5.36]OHV45658.1 alcohol dehydrogenase [Pseudofrankia sp. BMG5.36]